MGHLLADDDGMTLYIGCPDKLDGQDGVAALADFYQQVLGWPRYDAYGTPFLSASPKFRIGFDGDGWSDLRPPRWPDPSTHSRSTSTSACRSWTLPKHSSTPRAGTCCRTTPATGSTPIPRDTRSACTWTTSRAATGPSVARLVYDCFSPRSLACFYEGFVGAQERLEDSPERVVHRPRRRGLPNLAFQHAVFPAARWPDPAYPAQLHVDYRFTVDHEVPHYLTAAAKTAMANALRLGAVHIPPKEWHFADPAGHPFCM